MSLHRSAPTRFVAVAACAPPLAYLAFVRHYAVNAPYSDDWSRTRLVSQALHGHLTVHVLWAQYSEARLLVPNLFFAAFGFIDHLNLKHVVIFGALIFIVSYFLMLRMFRIYLDRPLTFLPVLGLGLIWFNVADVENALWAFQLAWYLALLFFFIMIYVLLVWPRNRKLALALAIFAAIGSSYSMLFGFVLWPVGLVCLLWVWSPARKRYGEVALWLFCGALTALVYLRGYRTGVSCVPKGSDCSLSNALTHPASLAKFFLVLVGNIVPINSYGHFWYKEIFGVLLCGAAGLITVRSIRERRSDVRVPLPLLLILFALLFDLTIALGRAHEGLAGALQYRYLMPNTLLLVGMVIYAGTHVPDVRELVRHHGALAHARTAALIGLAVLILGQSIFNAELGIRRAPLFRGAQVQSARTAVNLSRIPPREQGCYARDYVWNFVYRPADALARLRYYRSPAQRDHLMAFAPGTIGKFRAQGPPKRPGNCLRQGGPKRSAVRSLRGGAGVGSPRELLSRRSTPARHEA